LTIDKQWRFTYVNRQFEQIMHVRKEDILGLEFQKVFPMEEHSKFYDRYNQVHSTTDPFHFEEFSQISNTWVDVSVYPSEEGLTVYFKEINDRKKAEEELKKLSLVANKTVNSVYITDEQARVEWVNEGFTRITGYTLEEIIGRRPGDLLAGPETDNAQITTIRKKLMANEPFVQEVQNRNKAGEVYWSKLDVTPIVDQETGGGKKFIVIETVITEQKKAEQERLQLTQELLRRNRDLEQFTYIVSHNLRSPVANILGLTSLLANAEPSCAQEGLTSRLRQTAMNLDQIIRDLNEMLSLQAGVLGDWEKVSLPEVVEQALQILPGDCCGDITVDLQGVQEIGSTRSYVSSILSNLLSNAFKYKSPNRPLCLKVTAELQEKGQMLYLTVSDNGLGINMEKEGRNLFGLYKRFHFHVSGRGLGLYLVKTQAEALGGRVTVESTPNEGSTFKVWIKNHLQ
jgi:PAS domain S-box-containing protein